MFPVRRGRLVVSSYVPSPDPTDVGYSHYTLDLALTATGQVGAVAVAGWVIELEDWPASFRGDVPLSDSPRFRAEQGRRPDWAARREAR